MESVPSEVPQYNPPTPLEKLQAPIDDPDVVPQLQQQRTQRSPEPQAESRKRPEKTPQLEQLTGDSKKRREQLLRDVPISIKEQLADQGQVPQWQRPREAEEDSESERIPQMVAPGKPRDETPAPEGEEEHPEQDL